MILLEHEAKSELPRHGVPCPPSAVVAEAHAARGALAALALPVMVKAQIPAGGRGKAGGIVRAVDAEVVEAAARSLIGSTLHGHRVESVLVEECIAIEHEYYLAAMVEGANLQILVGREGGVDVESAGQAAGIERVEVDPCYGLAEYRLRDAFGRLGIPRADHAGLIAIAASLLAALRAMDATLVEVNPLARTARGLVALDARVAVDEGAFFRQPRFSAIAAGRHRETGTLARMRALEIQHVPIGGDVGLVGSGAGNGVTILDWLDTEGARAAAFMDLDYAVLAGKTREALELTIGYLVDEVGVRALLVNFTACGYRVDPIASTLVEVLDARGGVAVPAFINFQGNRGALARSIVADAGYHATATLGEAVRGAARAAATP